ncbi:MAG: hypothetical protein ACO3I0_11650, partial [Limisphaerales bacterium]
MTRRIPVVLVVVAFLSCLATTAAETRRVPGTFQGHHPIPDTPYLQEVGQIIPVSDPVVAVAGFRGTFWVATAKG